MTSDLFFAAVRNRDLYRDDPYWDVIFIDGLHPADQVWRDICNSLACVSDGGVIFVHDCFPPLEEFAREQFAWSAASGGAWCGTTWKAFWKYLREGDFHAYIIDAEVGIGVIDTRRRRTVNFAENDFFEFDRFVDAVRSAGFVHTPGEVIASWAG